MRKLSLIVFILIMSNLFAVLLYSCRCKTDVSRYCVELQSVSLDARDDGGLEPRQIMNNTVYAKALILTISSHEVKYECQRNTSSLYNAAFAMCKQPQEEMNYRDPVMHIFLNRDYDQAHPAGIDLKDLFIQKGEDYYLMTAPDDTTGTYTFLVQLEYQLTHKQEKDTLYATSAPLKLKK